MAILGIQFLISVSVAFIMQKLSPYYSMPRWIMCSGLYRYLYPTNDMLKTLAGKMTTKPPKGKRNAGKHSTNGQQQTKSGIESFTVPCNIDIVLEKTKFAFVCRLQYCFGVKSTHKRKELLSLTAAYWQSSDSGEKSMCITFGLFFLILSMGVLIIDESILEFGLETGYRKFMENLLSCMKQLGFTTREAPPMWMFKLSLAAMSSVVGAILGFPGLRLANLYHDSLYYCENQPLVKLTNKNFDLIRIFLVISMCTLRLLTVKGALQSYLNMANEKIRKLKKQTGKITNIEIQEKVARIFFYMSAVALQYLAPVLLLLFLSFSWIQINASSVTLPSSPLMESLSNSTVFSDGNVFVTFLEPCSYHRMHMIGICPQRVILAVLMSNAYQNQVRRIYVCSQLHIVHP
eukprot:gene19111-21028_t